MALFSERYGYVKPDDIIIRERINEPILNSIDNWLYNLPDGENWYRLQRRFWTRYLNKKEIDLDWKWRNDYIDIIRGYINERDVEWYKKLDAIEFILPYIKDEYGDSFCEQEIDELNAEFSRHNFAYRIIDYKIVEVNSEEEISSIENALDNPISEVGVHLRTALEKISSSQKEPDSRNSIKESISAVECYCRNKTNTTSFGAAINQIEKKIYINKQLKEGLNKIYAYTCNGDTGIRHALMDDDNPPTKDEAIFMLVMCSAFINYFTKKLG